MNPTVLSIGLVLLYLVVLVLLGIIAYSGYSLAPWLPIHRRDIQRVIALANIHSGDTFVELGSGTGLLTITVGKIAGVKSTGIELSPALVFISKVRKFLHRKSKARFVFGNVYKHSFADASVVYVFGMPRTNKKLIHTLRAQLKPGTRVISYIFKIEGLPLVTHDKPTEKSASIYIYTIQ